MTTITKRDIIDKIALKSGCKQVVVKEVLEELLDSIIESLCDKKRIELRKFGVFEVRTRPERKARNPKTGLLLHVPAKDVVAFKVGKEFKEKVEKKKRKRK